MFSNPVKTSNLVEEGTIVQVDNIRYVCKVRTLTGQILNSVQWLLPTGGATRSGDRFTPIVGERVMLNYGLGYPVIIGFFPRLQTSDGATPLKILDGQQSLDMGNYSPEGAIVWGDQNKPKDMIHGDRLLSSIGGAILGLFRSGSALLRAGRGAEVFLSKLDTMIRIVSRNWEHFTDVSSDVVRNYKGRVYRYVAYGPDFSKSKNEDYKLHFYFGDVTAAEKVKTGYRQELGEVPAASQVIYKEQITNDDNPPIELMRRTLELNGDEEIVIKAGDSFTRVKSTGLELRLTWKDSNTVTINEAKIHAVHQGGADVILDDEGIRATFEQGSVNMSSDSILARFDDSSSKLESGQAELDSGGGKCTVTPSFTRLSNSGHAVNVNSSGIQVT